MFVHVGAVSQLECDRAQVVSAAVSLEDCRECLETWHYSWPTSARNIDWTATERKPNIDRTRTEQVSNKHRTKLMPPSLSRRLRDGVFSNIFFMGAPHQSSIRRFP